MRDKAFNIAKNLKFKEYHRGLASIVYNFFDKKTSATHAWSENLATQNRFAGSGFKNENISNKKLAEEVQKSIIWKLEKREIHSPLTISGVLILMICY